MFYTPSEEAIAKVMKDTGMDRMQAIYHLRGKKIAQERAAEQVKLYPLGKNAYA
jgi:hypothetical protein